MYTQKFLTILLLLVALGSQAQNDPKGRFIAEFEGGISMDKGSSNAYLQDYAAGVSTNWGTTATFKAYSSPRLGISGAYRRYLGKFVMLDGRLGLARITNRTSWTNAYDPPKAGLLLDETRDVRDRLSYLLPSVLVGGSFMGIGLQAGIEFPVFLGGGTQRTISSSRNDGTSQEAISTVPIDTQDQPIYPDPTAPGGVRDFSYATPQNHGMNPWYLAAVVRLEYRFLNRPHGPLVFVTYRAGLTDAKGSQSPVWTLTTTYNPQTLEELKKGNRLSGFSAGIGWSF